MIKMDKQTKNSVNSLKKFAKELLTEFRKVNDKFHKDIEEHKFDQNPTIYRKIQDDYEKWIEKNISGNGFSYDYTPDGREILSLEMELAS